MPLNKNKLSQICAGALLAGGLVTCVAPVVAATAAGTMIKNLATVTYEDVNGNQYSAQSNEAVITVKQVYSAEIGVDTAKTAAAGQVVYSQHTLTNTGNGEDTYTINADNFGINDLTDDLNASGIKVYIDSNGNGLADAGEQEVPAGGTITLTAGQSVELVMAVSVPNTASPGDELGVKLTATTLNGTVNDLTTANGLDTAEGTNQTWITVSNNAVLNYTKSAVLDAANNQITYTLTVSNTGNQAATSVKIYDAFPAGTTYVDPSATASGLLESNGDMLPVAQALSEAAGMDLNDDGDTTDTTDLGIYAEDSSIAPGQTVSLSFTVEYDPATFNNNAIPGSAGDVIKNKAYLTGDLDGNPATTESPIPTNPTQTTLPQIYAVDTDDTGQGSGTTIGTDASNNGADDTDDTDDAQVVDQAPSGSTVLFNVVLTNTGTGPDTLELAIDKGTFPAGTTFTYWNAAGTVQLTDTNAEASVDSGLLQAGVGVGESKTIMIKAQLPADASGDNGGLGYKATLSATSANDPAAAPAVDTTDLILGNISSPGADIKDAGGAATPGVNTDALGAAPYTINDGSNPGTRVTYAGTVGGTVIIPFYIDNDAGSSDSFQLSAGSSWNGTAVSSLPTGWSVQFFKGDGTGQPTGTPLTSTELLPGGAASKEYVAVVTIPSDPAYALADYVADNNGDGTPDIMDANGDLDGDQPIFIRIVSSNSGASDIMLDAVDVTSLRQVALTPPGSNQIQPGGSVDYVHTLDNTGNTEETLELSTSNSSGTNTGWNNTVMVDTNGDGTPDKTLAQLVPGVDVIKGVDAAGNLVNIVVTDADLDGLPEVTLPAGVSFVMTPTVYAPSDAAPGTNDILTITATNTDPAASAPDAKVEDVSSVILGQVRLNKTVAYDAACDGTADTPFAANLTAEVAPNQCAIWQIVAENQGDANALNVIIRDNVPAYTTYEANSLLYALGTINVGNPLVDPGPSDAAADDAGERVADDITFFVGTGSAPATGKGGTLVPGQIATVRFSTRVE